ncbi:MAG: tetratricopeptide repeat protein [Elainellaceae cyanobacterium]
MVAIVLFVIMAAGYLIMLTGGIWGLILAFQDSAVWGLLYLFVPFAAIVFVIKKWSRIPVRKSFFLQIGGFLVGLLGILGFAFMSNSLAGNGLNPALTPGSPDEIPVEASTDSPDVSTEPSITADGAASEPLNNQTAAASDYPCDFTQCMNVGYAAMQQQDYQTALINFKRALEQRPGNPYATEAIQNAEAAIQETSSQ